jgi:hypothetical protein
LKVSFYLKSIDFLHFELLMKFFCWIFAFCRVILKQKIGWRNQSKSFFSHSCLYLCNVTFALISLCHAGCSILGRGSISQGRGATKGLC